ncbi:MAG TPA: apolipoprotein N-acyltransferase [Phnomibacter sp.]|nr:apolipoprotein N-acyltransferase [Phnomibacter sp.]
MQTSINRVSRLLPWLTGPLLVLAWPTSPATMVIFFALVPLLWYEQHCKNGARFFWVAWANMLIWNAGTTWWIWNSTGPGAVGAIIANSLLMVFPWMAYRATRRRWGHPMGYVAMVLYWLAFEYLHHNWELSWPWLTLGNVFATHPEWIYWYSYTGTTGGSLWVWVVNLTILHTVVGHYAKASQASHHFTRQAFLRRYAAAPLLLLPLLLSVVLKPAEPQSELGHPNVVVVQPNVEAYTEKFTTSPALLLEQLIKLSASQIDSQTRLLVWPETAIPAQVWENKINENPVFTPLWAFLQQHPQILLVTGIDSYKFYGTENPGGFSIRQMADGTNYEAFNTAMGVTANQPPQLYHKSKLVPGVETLPSWLGFMGSLFDGFGGISGSLGRSSQASVFQAPGNPYKAAPVICYESIYSHYTTEYIRRGANILTVITNDGWWGNTQGHHQHMHMARLRAIENRIWVARSANTGISCFIAPNGQVLQPQPWDTEAVIKLEIPTGYTPTFYGNYGDWMSRLAWPLALLMLAATLAAKWVKLPFIKK